MTVQEESATGTATHEVTLTDAAAAKAKDGDLFREFHGMSLGVDRFSAPYLEGAVIDFVDTIEKQGFTIDNPNAGGSCACGDSFN